MVSKSSPKAGQVVGSLGLMCLVVAAGVATLPLYQICPPFWWLAMFTVTGLFFFFEYFFERELTGRWPNSTVITMALFGLMALGGATGVGYMIRERQVEVVTLAAPVVTCLGVSVRATQQTFRYWQQLVLPVKILGLVPGYLLSMVFLVLLLEL